MLGSASAAGTVGLAEHQRLKQSHAALQDQFEAANEVLVALGRSAGDPDAVLTTIVESARRICQSQAAQLYVLENGVYGLIKAVGLSKKSVAYIAEHPMPMDRDTLIGRVGLDHTTQQIPDVLADPGYGRKDLQRVAHFRTTLAAPLLIGSYAFFLILMMFYLWTIWRRINRVEQEMQDLERRTARGAGR